MNRENHAINNEIVGQIQLKYNKIPLAVFLLGTNGSGKSSLRNYLNLTDIQTNIDPDVLNRIYQVKYPHSFEIEAARQAIYMYDNALVSSMNICLESTLAGRGTIQRIIAAKRAGYHTIAYYIGLHSLELNLERIAMRVANGGHNIPELTVRRRFTESADNLIMVRPYLDEIQILDNSEPHFRLQYSFVNDKITKCHDLTEQWATLLHDRLSSIVQITQ